MAPRDRRDSDGLDEFGGSTRLQNAESIRRLLDQMQTTEDDKQTREMDPQMFRALLKTEAAKRPVPEPEVTVERAPGIEESAEENLVAMTATPAGETSVADGETPAIAAQPTRPSAAVADTSAGKPSVADRETTGISKRARTAAISWRTWALLAVLVAVAAMTLALRA